MSKIDKLAHKITSIPADFRWDDLIKVLKDCGYTAKQSGKTGGSRRAFVHSDGHVILLHEPHPSSIVKKTALKQVVDCLIERGLLDND